MERVTKKELEELESVLTKDDTGASIYFCETDSTLYIWDGKGFVTLLNLKGK